MTGRRVNETVAWLILMAVCSLVAGCSSAPTATATALPAPSPTVSATPTLRATATRTNTPAPTATPTRTNTPTPTATPGIAWSQGARLLVTALQPVSPTVTVQDKQLIEFAHCEIDTDQPVTFPMADYAPITVTVTVADAAFVSGTEVEVPIPAGLHGELISIVRDVYGPELDQIEAEMKENPFVIPIGDVITFIVAREDRVYQGTVSFEVAGIEYEAAYAYSLSVPVRAGERTERCGG